LLTSRWDGHHKSVDYRGLLRPRRELPRRRASEQRDELARALPDASRARTERIAHLGTEETAAMRDFNAAYDRSGSDSVL
jgi:hypothetical protein